MLSFDGLWKGFGDKQVLRDLTFTVQTGELFGFCGAKGSGKTTALRIALGVLEADRGAVRLAGAALGPGERQRVGYMPEERGLYAKMRPVDQLTYFAALSGLPRDEAKRRAHEWMERLRVVAAPRDKLEKLSLGNQQKVQLIAAVIHEPAVLILDEPFSGLDPVAVDDMVEVLREFAAQGVPVLFSSHQLDLVERLCDRVAIISNGATVAVGSVPELRGQSDSGRLKIVLAEAPPRWFHRLPGVQVERADDSCAEFRLLPGTSTQDVLMASAALGRVEHFGWRELPLSEIFRRVAQ